MSKKLSTTVVPPPPRDETMVSEVHEYFVEKSERQEVNMVGGGSIFYKQCTCCRNSQSCSFLVISVLLEKKLKDGKCCFLFRFLKDMCMIR